MPTERDSSGDVYTFKMPGRIPEDRQQRAEDVLGRSSYELLASKAYRFAGARTQTIELLIREVRRCLKECHASELRRKAEVLLWAAYAHLYMQVEDLACLLSATHAFGKAWELEAEAKDTIVSAYLAFGDPARGSGASATSTLQQVSSLCQMLRALWLPRRRECQKLFPGASNEAWQLVKRTGSYCQAIARAISNHLMSDTGREWYALYLRYKHGAPLMGLDLFHSNIAWVGKGSIDLSNGEKSTLRNDIAERRKRMHVLLPEHPHGERSGIKGNVLWSFPCTSHVADQALTSSRVASELETIAALCVVRRAESVGGQTLLVVHPKARL